jgi:hypothetical protein
MSEPLRLVCSGTVDPTGLIGPLIESAFDSFECWFGPPDRIVSGCARGVDSIWIEMALTRWQKATIDLVVPAAPHNAHMVGYVRGSNRRRTEILRMPPARDYPTAYMQRNDQLEHMGDVLQAFPSQPNEVRRSGTWATYRRFMKKEKPIYLSPCLPGVEPQWMHL